MARSPASRPPPSWRRCARAERIGALVVSADKTSIAGIVSDRGIMDAIADRGIEVLGESIGSVMTRQVVTCSRQDRVGAVMALMTNRRIRHVPVVENDKRLCGIVSIGDVVSISWTGSSAKRTRCGSISAARGDHRRSRCSSVFGAIGAASGGRIMTTGGKSFDYEQALDDPCRIFGEPGNVLSHPDLDAKQKRAILESWWQDALRLSESEGENMGGGNEPMLKRVNDALLELERQTGVGAAHKRTIA